MTTYTFINDHIYIYRWPYIWWLPCQKYHRCTVYIHRIRPYIWWFPCQKYCTYTTHTRMYVVLATSTHAQPEQGMNIVSIVACQARRVETHGLVIRWAGKPEYGKTQVGSFVGSFQSSICTEVMRYAVYAVYCTVQIWHWSVDKTNHVTRNDWVNSYFSIPYMLLIIYITTLAKHAVRFTVSK